MRRLFSVLLKYKKVFVYGAMAAILCSLFLFSPKAPEDYCGKYIELRENVGFPVNCDSWDYVETTKEPHKLLEEKCIRQSRPLYVLIASAIGYALSPVFPYLPISQLTALDEILGSSFFWSFIILNFFTLLFSLLLFNRVVDILSDKKFPEFPRYVLPVFLASNIVIKTSFWSAHQQMLTLFSPLFCIYVALRIVLSKELRGWKIYAVSLLGGFLLLMYGNFIVLLPTILLATAVRLVRTGSFSLLRAAKILVISTLLFVFPALLWCSILLLVTGSVYNHEIAAYRQFIWIVDKLLISFNDFYEQFNAFSLIYGTTLYRTVLIFLTGAVLLKIFNFAQQRFMKSETETPPNYSLMRNMIAAVFLLYFFFFWAMGYYSERLTFTLVPVVLCLIALELNVLLSRAKPLTVRLVYVFLLICALAWVYFGVTAPETFKDLTGIEPFEFLSAYI